MRDTSTAKDIPYDPSNAVHAYWLVVGRDVSYEDHALICLRALLQNVGFIPD